MWMARIWRWLVRTPDNPVIYASHDIPFAEGEQERQRRQERERRLEREYEDRVRRIEDEYNVLKREG
jgi:hypothetical protein